MSPARRERAAKVLVEIMSCVGIDPAYADRKVAKANGCSIRSIRRWRKALDIDPELARLVREKRAQIEDGWADEVPGALRAAVNYLRKAAEESDHKDPEAIKAIASAMRDLSDVASLWKLIDVRLSRSARANAAADQPVVPGRLRAAASSTAAIPN